MKTATHVPNAVMNPYQNVRQQKRLGIARWPLYALGAAFFLSLAAISASAAAPAAEPRPNILFIMVDEMRWDAMSCAGHPIVKTPHLDRLAAGGTRFEAAYTCAPVCVPSRYSFFTARYAHVHGSLGNEQPTRPGELFLPAILRHQGYQTAISGKLHFLPQDQEHGFNLFWSYGNEGPGILQSWPQYLRQKHGDNAKRLLDQPYPDDPLGRDIARLPYPKEDMQSFWITDRAMQFLDERDQQKPFFLFVSYLDPHSPSHLAEPYWSMFDPDGMPRPEIPDTIKKERAAAIAAGAWGPGPARSLIDDERMAQILTATYYAKVKVVDDNVGRLLAKLEQQGLDRNTIVVFTADHGNMLGDRGRWFKSLMYDGSSRIPLLIKAPAASPLAASFNQGKVVPQLVENIDVMPTLMEMAGSPLPAQPGFQGQSAVELVAGRDASWQNVAFAGLGTQMIRTPHYKLIKNRDAWELYDMVQDPRETRDLSADPAHAAALGDLQSRLEAWLADRPAAPVMEGVEKSQSAGPEKLAKPRAAKKKKKRTSQ
jgi:arylsulfatase A-like enzyme